MKTTSPYALGLSILLSLLMTVPANVWAEPQTAGQRAGEVSRVIPAVSIARGTKNITASAKTAVDWQDLVNTQVNARARIALDDGSVLNVGSESSLKVVKSDAGAQQTELELTYGKLRTQAQKISKPDGKFEVRTPAGVAGVVGTDFFLEFDKTTGTMNVIVFEGFVKVCNLAGICAIAKAGQSTGVRSGDNSGPTPPVQATLDTLVASTKDTELSGPSGTAAAGPHTAVWWTIGLAIAVPAVVLPIVLNRSTGIPVAPPVKGNCIPNPNTGLCP
jgi:ferric-dicitrate binding protein FerR (iron transport regulator)